ncbi:hypothetical protein POM88_026035 [Heracleum sosnowskyi]|uniref:Uncharacterized protein n=1 Tax=Heracleum sosnowskyi TaxID=360622 RepID=A0AAD8MN48_9APIA|nr:hypothetical protein POM88_026035 [Heracleum sosnowskyi]
MFGCKSLGHSIAACPIVTRVWVQKVPSPPGPPAGDSADINAGKTEQQDDPLPNNENIFNVPCSPKEHEHPWTEVKRKNRATSLSLLLDEASPTPPRTFKNLKLVDEINQKKATQDQGYDTSDGNY